MANVKKTAKSVKPKKTVAKKPAAKKPAAKKPAVKKPAVKKPAVKKTAAKKPAVKKPAAKKPAAKKAVAKKPAKPAAAKPTTAKPAATKPAAAKPAAAKPAAPKPAVKKSAQTSKPVETLDQNVKFRNLFDAYVQGKLPFAHGYIVSSFFNENSAYSIYEIVSYAGVKEIFQTEQGLQFITGGKKLYVLVEPASYHNKHVDPVSRAQGESIPKRYSELETITAVANQTKIMIAKEPDEVYGSFTILKPSGINFATVFYQLPDVYTTMAKFFEESLNRQRKVPQADAKKAAQLIASILQKSMGFQGEFE